MKPAILGFVFGLLLAIEISQAAVPKKQPLLDPAFFPEQVKLSVEEILSMPVANRVEVAKLRKTQLIEPLDKMAFSDRFDFQTRWSALVLLAQIQGPGAEKTLAKAINHKEWFLRNAALLTYPSVLPKKAGAVALQMLEDKALVIRSAAIDVLENFMDSQVRESLWAELDHPRNYRKNQSLWIRPQILHVLAKEPDSREIPLFLNHLRDKDAKLHPYAIQALEKLTRQSLGRPQMALTEKREIWLKWAKKTQAEINLN